MVEYMKKWSKVIVVTMILAFFITGCAWNSDEKQPQKNENEPQVTDIQNEGSELEEELAEKPAEEKPEEVEIEPVPMYTTEDVNLRTGAGQSYEALYTVERGTLIEVLQYQPEWSKINYEKEILFVASEFLSEEEPMERKRIVIDAGHQNRGNPEKEPNGPGSSKMKAKVSSGTRGVSTGIYEYELNLQVTLQLRDELENRGYEVILVRDRNDVDISNVERAMVANNREADCFVRIHANGDNNKSVKGMLTICQTVSNPFNANVYPESYSLSKEVLNGMLEQTGAKDRGIWETDTMTGINWCEVPSTIVEMGFMSNPEEDQLLNTLAYQEKIVQGIANGLDSYFSSRNE